MEKPSRPPAPIASDKHAPTIVETAAVLNRDYASWDNVRSSQLPFPAESLWNTMTTLRRASGRTVRIGGMTFMWNVTSGMFDTLQDIDVRHRWRKTISHGLNAHSKRAYAVSSTMEEAIASSLISGCMLQAKSVKKHMREDRPPKNEYETTAMRTYSAINAARELSLQPLSPDHMLRINEEMGGTGWRTEESVTSEKHSREPLMTPFPASRIRKAVEDMCVFASEDDIHPLVRAFALEYMVLRVQPFSTGNGRTARALASWCMARNGYEVDRYLSVSGVRRSRQSAYQRAFLTSEAEYDDMTYAVSFGIDAVSTAVDNFLTYVDRKTREQEDLLEGVSLNDLSTRQRTILTDVSKSQEGVTVEELAAKHQVSYQTARADLLLLIGRGFVEKGARDGHKDTYVRSRK